MTYIEFYDRVTIENLCGCLASPPKRVVLVGNKSRELKVHTERYSEILHTRGHNVEFLYRSVNKNDLNGIVSALEELVEKYGQCFFDLTGGDEIYLVAVGMLKERYKDGRVQLHSFNFRYNKLVDCDMDGISVTYDEEPYLSVRENIRIYGGDVVYDNRMSEGTHLWDLDRELIGDIDAMWDVCRENSKKWNYQMQVFAAAELLSDGYGPSLTTTASVERLRENLKLRRDYDVVNDRIIERLLNKGLIKDFFCDDTVLSVTYKNENVKRCLTKAGQILELKVYAAAKTLCDKEGKSVYSDAMTGVVIDWDGKAKNTLFGPGTTNEVDVILMKGMIPVFISCKNGNVEIDELYKLNSVAQRFGSKYAKKVLVASALEGAQNEGYIRQRAEDMGIKLISNICSMNDSELCRAMNNLFE